MPELCDGDWRELFEKFTERARRVIVLAQEEARLLNHSSIGSEHLLLGVVHEGQGVAAHTLEALGIRLAAVRHAIEREVPRGSSPAVGTLDFTARAKKSLENALRESLQLGHNYIGTEHILLGLMRTEDGRAARVLRDLGATFEGVRAQALALLADRPVPPEESGIHNLPEEC